MSQFVTINKSDDQFWDTMTGRFSKTQFAQPVRNLNVNSIDETVTFKIIDKHSLSLVGALIRWYSFTRNIYLLFPILGGLSYMMMIHGPASLSLVVSSFFSLQFFLLALTLYNDFSDYVNGVDRINEYSSKKPLIQGWVRPYQAKQLAQLFLGLAFASGLYCFVAKPLTLVLALAAMLIGFSLSATLISRKYKGISLVGTFLLGGPLLVLGYEYLLYGKITNGSILLGIVFGYHALKYDFSKQVRDIYYSSKAKVVTLSNFFGFERSKFIYSFMSFCHLLALGTFAWTVGESELILILIVSVCFEFYINSRLYGASSFLSSNISDCLSLQKFHYCIEMGLIVYVFLRPQWLSLF